MTSQYCDVRFVSTYLCHSDEMWMDRTMHKMRRKKTIQTT